MRRRIAWRSAVVLFLMACPAGAQTAAPPLTSNRPGIGDSEALVGRGVVQVEGGFQGQAAPPGSDQSWTQSWGEINFRVGLSRRLEVFTGWDGLSIDRVHVDGDSQRQAGGNDLLVGAKLAVLHEDRHGVTLTVAPAWSFPVGSEEFTTGTIDGSFRVLWARSLPRDWSVGGNLVTTRTSDAAGRYWDNGVTLGATRTVTSTVSVFAEAAGDLPRHQPAAWTLDGGVAWVARPNLQWDVSAGHTFENRGPDWFVSAGITVRRR